MNPFVEALERAEKKLAEQYGKISEAAAFLDGLAKRLDSMGPELKPPPTAARWRRS